MQVTSMHFKARAHVKLHDERLQRNLRKMQGKFVGHRSRVADRARRFRGHARVRESGPRSRARKPRCLARALREERDRARRDGALCGDARRHQRARARDRRQSTASRKIIKSKSMVSEESALDHAIEAAGLTVVETDLGEYILQINDYEPPSHIDRPGAAQVEGGGRRSLPQGARHAAQDGNRGAVPRSARRVAPALPDRRHGDLRRQFLRRRDRLGRARHQRGQRDADDDAAEGARRHFRHREDRADARGRRHADAPAAAIGDRAVDLELRRRADRPERRGRVPRRRAHVFHRRRLRTHRRARQATCARRCAASAAARA